MRARARIASQRAHASKSSVLVQARLGVEDPLLRQRREEPMSVQLRTAETYATRSNSQQSLLRNSEGVQFPRRCSDQQLLFRQCGYPPSLGASTAGVGQKRERSNEATLTDLLERELLQRPVARPFARIRRQRGHPNDATPAQTRRLHMDGVSRLGSPAPQRVETPTELESWLHSALRPKEVTAAIGDQAASEPVGEAQVPSIRRLLRLASQPQLSKHASPNGQPRADSSALTPNAAAQQQSPSSTSSHESPSSFDSIDEQACMGALLRASLDPQRAQRLLECGAVQYLVQKLRDSTNSQVVTQIAAALVNLDPATTPVPGLAQALSKKLSLLTSECSERLMLYTLGDGSKPVLSRVEIDTLARHALASLPRHLVLLRRLAELSAGGANGHATFWNHAAVQLIENLKPATAAQAEHLLAILQTIPLACIQNKRAAFANHIVIHIASRFPDQNSVQRAAVELLGKIAAA